MSGLETRFLYDGAQLAAEANASGAIIRRYVPGPGVDETLAVLDASGVSYPLADSRGTPMAWTLANGQIAVQQYGAFGEEGPANIGRFGFTGQMRLPEIGLDYYKARFYDPSIGRFLTPDPAGYIDSPNLYAYVLNDPVNNTDPSGLEAEENVSDPIDIFGRILTRGSASPGGGSQESRLGSGSFFHFLDPLADNGSQGPGMGEMMMCPSMGVVVRSAEFLGSFGQGFGDALSFGLYSKAFAALPFGLGEFYADQKENGGGYTPGLFTGGAAGFGRVAYAGAARAGSAAAPARQAVAFRNDLKGAFSGLGSAHPRNYTYEQMLSKYGSDRAVKAAAGRTNGTLNAAGAAAMASAGAQYAAGCP